MNGCFRLAGRGRRTRVSAGRRPARSSTIAQGSRLRVEFAESAYSERRGRDGRGIGAKVDFVARNVELHHVPVKG